MRVTPEAGDRIADRYLLQEPIGRGGMGVVWRAWDERLERPVAVKYARIDDERAARRLMGEARNAARLHHPNIVGVFDFIDRDEDGTCWIVMEYVPSHSLAQIVRDRGPLTPEEAGAIGCQIADALATSHGGGVVHGDVTPENILVTEDGVARLTDFGISRAMWTDVTLSVTGGVLGKPRYLAPEVAKGLPAGEKSDVFSLGASLFAAVEGRSPYGEAEHMMAYLARAAQGRIEPAHRGGPLAEPLAALLEVEPGSRPDAARARELLTNATPPGAHVLERVAAAPRPSLPPVPSVARLLRRARRRRRPVVAAVAVVLAGAITAGVVLFGPSGPSGSSGPKGKADAGGPAGAGDRKPPPTAKPGTIGDPRTADPCRLLDAGSLSRFGDTELDPDYGEFNRCDVVVRNNSGDDDAEVQVTFDAHKDTFDGALSSRLVADFMVVTLQRDGKACERAVLTADDRQIRIVGKQLGHPSPDPCALADAATDHVIGVLDDHQVPRRTSTPAADSLVRLDACTLLDAADLRRLPGVRVEDRDRGFGSWECDWSSDDGEREVQIQFDRDTQVDDYGPAVDVAGTPGYVTQNEAEDDSCTVRTPHRTYTSPVGERTSELFAVTVYAPLPTGQLCHSATAFAATVAGSIAERLPQG